MDHSMKAMCGAYCLDCAWREKTDCEGCLKCASAMFWGTCAIAACCKEKGLKHCGYCPELPCQKLIDAFNDPVHGDNGARLRNLKNWAAGIEVYEPLK